MSICVFCGKEKIGASSCILSSFVINGQHYRPVPFKKPPGSSDQTRCSDCNVLTGGYHHLGCTMEVCPKCGYHWVFCRCSGTKVKISPVPPGKNKVIPFPKKCELKRF